MKSAAQTLRARLQEADTHLRARRPAQAEHVCAEILAVRPDVAEAHLIRARARQMRGFYEGMLESVEAACAAQPAAPLATLMRIEALICLGEIAAACESLKALKARSGAKDAMLLARIAELETQLGRHVDALATLRKAAALEPQDTAIAYNLASAEIANGELAAAEEHLDTLIAGKARDYDAYYNRATLRSQTAESNHINELRAQLEGNPNAGGEVALCYALAKELEDLGEYDESFRYLKRGANARHNRLQYRVEADIAAMEKIARTFDEAYLKAAGGDAGEGAIFIIGLKCCSHGCRGGRAPVYASHAGAQQRFPIRY